MHVLMLTQSLDEHNWLLSFIPRWVDALARHVDRLDVITLELGAYAPPPNVSVYSMGKERGRGRAGLLIGFYRAFLPLIGKADAVFVHMIPRYGVLAAPLTLLQRKPLVLWYTHRQVDPELRLVTAACWRVLTAGPGSFPLETPKLRTLGHGIDTDFFAPNDAATRHDDDSAPPAIVQVARLMPIKHQKTLLRALALLDTDARAVFVGGVPPGQNAAYVDELKELAANLGILDRVEFTGALAASGVHDQYRGAAAAVNLSPTGLFDKAALESMACAVPTVVSSPAFDSLLGDHADRLRIDSPEDVEGLAARLNALLAQPTAARIALGAGLREAVITGHSLRRLMTRLVAVLETGEPG